MGLSILTNATSLNAQKNLSQTQDALASSISKLSSGMRINKAGDDAAGLGISESLKSQIRSLSQAQRNTNDGISMSQVAEGGMNEMQGIVSRMRELAVQSANGTLGKDERGYIQTEFTQLKSEINRIGATTEFNGQTLLDGKASTGLSMQVGMRNSSNDRIAMSITKLSTSTLGTGVTGAPSIASATLSTMTGAQNALASFDKAIQQLSSARAKIGAVQNRMSVTVSNLATSVENLTAANGRIRDVDVAEESAKMTKSQILSQAGLAVLAQANQLPQSALSLLK
jgi:flagellin